MCMAAPLVSGFAASTLTVAWLLECNRQHNLSILLVEMHSGSKIPVSTGIICLHCHYYISLVHRQFHWISHSYVIQWTVAVFVFGLNIVVSVYQKFLWVCRVVPIYTSVASISITLSRAIDARASNFASRAMSSWSPVKR